MGEDTRRWRAWTAIVGAAGVVAAAVAVFAFFGFPTIGDFRSPTVSSPPPLPVPPDGAANAAFQQELSIEDAIDYEECAQPGFSGSYWKKDAVMLGGQSFARVISCYLYGNPTEGYMDYLVPSGKVLVRYGGTD